MNLLTVDQAAELLRVSPVTIRRLCREGYVPALLVRGAWRVRQDHLLSVLERVA